jgi:hypothetical protein
VLSPQLPNFLAAVSRAFDAMFAVIMSRNATQEPFDRIDNNSNANKAEKGYQQNGTPLSFCKLLEELLNAPRFLNYSFHNFSPISPRRQCAVYGTRPEGAVAVDPLPA